MANTIIHVTGEGGHDILIGRRLLDEVALGLGPGVKQVLLVHPEALTVSAELLDAELKGKGYETSLIAIPNGEDAKRIEVATFCWSILGQRDFTRSDAVIGIGGGATTDLAGFVAANWLRGVKYIAIPTTVLGMVDAAIGGKTGVNTAEGKNLVGAFHAPSAVIIDIDSLETLPRNEIVAGFGEVVKYGFIADPEILQILERHPERSVDPRTDEFRELVERSARVKAQVVSQDFKESGNREFLNYGHTLGHAIELNERFQWRHGAAVSVGMCFAAELARLAGRLKDEVVDRHRNILQLLGLPTTYRASEFDKLLAAMQRDKKSRGGTLRFVVLDELAKPTIMSAPTPELLHAAFQEIVD